MSIGFVAFVPTFERSFLEAAIGRLQRYGLFVYIDPPILQEISRDWDGYLPVELSVLPQNLFDAIARSKVQTGFEFSVVHSRIPKEIKLTGIETEEPATSLELPRERALIEKKLSSLKDSVVFELSLSSPCYSVGFAFAAALAVECDGLLFDSEEGAFLTYSGDPINEVLKSDLCQELRQELYD